MQPTCTTALNITTTCTSYNNQESTPVKSVNIDNKIPNKPEDKQDIIEYTINLKGNNLVYCCIGNLDNDQKNYKETLKIRMQSAEKIELEDRWFDKDISNSLAELYPTAIYKN
jgi:hypothetical protein